MTILNQLRSLVNGDQVTAGTSLNLRNEFWENFRKTYPDQVTLDIDGAIITFRADHSTSGKTTNYWADIDKGMYQWLTGSCFGLKKNKKQYMSIQNGTITIHGGGNYYKKIENERVNAII